MRIGWHVSEISFQHIGRLYANAQSNSLATADGSTGTKRAGNTVHSGNPLLKKPLEISDVKPLVVSHRGATHGQNFIPLRDRFTRAVNLGIHSATPSEPHSTIPI